MTATMEAVKTAAAPAAVPDSEADVFIDQAYIEDLLKKAEHTSDADIQNILDKAERYEGLGHQEIAALLTTKDPAHNARIFDIAGKIKRHIYGNRIVMFAPLYVSDYCVNRCAYCSYNCGHEFNRNKLSMDEVREEVKLLEQMGHKRIALEAGGNWWCSWNTSPPSTPTCP
ncbi:hypothetical protein FACS1894137_16690 [Spirochaetia bacterium]|nr:hypothetical protein FACS1894137_16690 [Spirochaetia bacterium]